MLRHKDHFHGSDLEKIETIYQIKKEEILSFSANVNPLGLSGRLREELSANLDVITAYPDREYRKLRETIGSYCLCDPDDIVVGNGSTELISLFIQITRPKRALILGPTYSEYEREVSLGGGASLYFPLPEEQDFKLEAGDLMPYLCQDIDLLILCNPNNPTSSAVPRQTMRKILDSCKQNGIFVMVDETYVEFAEDYKKIESLPLTSDYNNLIVLRGISKFFAAPGLRLGYGITGNRDLIQKINALKNPWTINSLAETAGRLMFTDKDYIHATRQLISSERSRVCRALDAIPGLRYFPPAANFVLVKILAGNVTADQLFEAGIRERMMIRNCSTFPFLDQCYFRFCFMKEADNSRLLKLIERTMTGE